MIQNFDQQLFLLIHNLAGKSRLLDFFGTFLADYFGYLIIIFMALLIFRFESWKKRIYYFSLISLSVVLSRGIITETIRFFYHRPRPFQLLGFDPVIAEVNQGAFPSGHMAFYLAIILPAFLIKNSLGWYLTGAVALMGIARVFVGVHWPLDIVGGVIVGLASVWLVERYLISQKAETAETMADNQKIAP